MSAFKCTVVSFVPFPLREVKPGLIPGVYLMEASDVITPQLLIVDAAKYFVYIDSTRGSLPVETGSDKVAQSICDDFVDGQLAITEFKRPAIFWVPGIIDEATLKQQHKVMCQVKIAGQRSWMIDVCKIADNDWRRYKTHTAISDNQRKFANMLGYKANEHEWMVMDEAINFHNCPVCKSRVDKEAIVCISCRYILNRDKYNPADFIGGSAFPEPLVQSSLAQHNVIG